MFTKIVERCRTDFVPCKSSFKLPEQQSLFMSGYSNSHIKMGFFYEILTACLFGGKLTDSILRSQRASNKSDGPMPDIWDKNKGLMGESKACRLGHQLNLLDGQINLYRKFQIIQPNTRIYYAIWRHRFQKIKKYKGGEGKLFEELAGKTAAGIVIPFSIILHLHGMGAELRKSIREKYNVKLRRYEKDNWDHCTRVSSTIFNGFLLKPRRTLAMLSLDQDDFIWERYMTPPITINENQVKSVPFVLMVDMDHSKAVKQITDTVPF